MKHIFKRFVVTVLGWQVRLLRRKHQFKIIGVVGSIGKTSTKMAVAQTLGKSLRVRYEQGNYNDIVSVPLIFFGHELPPLFNPLAWLRIMAGNFRQIYGDYPYDVVVVELGTDGPGQIAAFSKYLRLDMAIITAVAPEHMEHFADLKAVADEELAVTTFSNRVFYNADLIPMEFHTMLPSGSIGYGMTASDADFRLANVFHSASGLEGDVKYGEGIFVHIAQEVVSETQLYSALAAVVVGHGLGLKPTEILAGLRMIVPVNGRLRRLRGINGSMIIDDTYNASPEAVKAGLASLYKLEAPQKIAVLGNMNELGVMSAQAHKEIGELCDPKQLALVVTIGPDANAYLAPAAQAKGCQVQAFDSPYAAGEYLQGRIEPGAIIFAKGSQNGVFAEEAVKQLLADPEDGDKLVRQSEAWRRKKAAQFKSA